MSSPIRTWPALDSARAPAVAGRRDLRVHRLADGRRDDLLPRGRPYLDAYGAKMWNAQLAATTVTVIPVLVVFFVVPRHAVTSLAHTGLKG